MATPISVGDLPALMKPGMTVFVQGSVGQPQAIMRALDHASDTLGGLQFVSPLTPGLNSFRLGSGTQTSSFETFFDFRDLRRSWEAGPIDFLPIHYSAIIPFLEARGRIDMALIQLAPPDARGCCSTGLAADFVPALLDRCDRVVAELNRAMPAVSDGPSVPLERLDHVIESDEALPVMELPALDEESGCIARHVAGLVRDGDPIQFGVGKLPQLAATALGDKNDLGLHTGLVSPVVMPLIERGVMTGRRKSIDWGKHVTGAACGDRPFYDWIADRADFAFRPVTYTHAADVLARIDNLVAINAVLEVDLFGQANAEIAAGRQISGSGGLVDFVRGARASRGGRAIICLRATRDGGKQSNIVVRLDSVATIGRADIDIVVTEFGVARLAHASVEARANALIAIAAPEFRESLRDQCTSAWRK